MFGCHPCSSTRTSCHGGRVGRRPSRSRAGDVALLRVRSSHNVVAHSASHGDVHRQRRHGVVSPSSEPQEKPRPPSTVSSITRSSSSSPAAASAQTTPRPGPKLQPRGRLHEDTAPAALRETESRLLSPASCMSCIARSQSPRRLRRGYVSPSLATANRARRGAARRGGAMNPCATEEMDDNYKSNTAATTTTSEMRLTTKPWRPNMQEWLSRTCKNSRRRSIAPRHAFGVTRRPIGHHVAADSAIGGVSPHTRAAFARQSLIASASVRKSAARGRARRGKRLSIARQVREGVGVSHALARCLAVPGGVERRHARRALAALLGSRDAREHGSGPTATHEGLEGGLIRFARGVRRRLSCDQVNLAAARGDRCGADRRKGEQRADSKLDSSLQWILRLWQRSSRFTPKEQTGRQPLAKRNPRTSAAHTMSPRRSTTSRRRAERPA